ncbi:MAG: Alpha-D-kanosaminyltransferase [Candidatus Dichloromethanomonas elyunquensis]|nr:MAG: Alpha-D-kanosaminyltransferase [Candidatus Dichloromethanomonas elyunquensis]
MRILLLTQYFPPEKGAAQVRLRELAKGLKNEGHEVTVVTAFPNHPTGIIPPEYRGKGFAREEMDGIRVLRTWVYPVQRGRFWLRLCNYFSFVFSSLYGIFRSGKQDLIVVESPPLFIGFSAIVASVVKKAPYIFNVSDLWPESAVQLGLVSNKQLIRMCEWLETYFYRKALKLSAQTVGIVEGLKKKGAAPQDILFLPNGVDTDLFQPRERDKDLEESLGLQGKSIVLYAGTMGYAHGIETALEAADILRGKKEIVFLLVGDGSERPKLEEIARGKGLPNVIFIDFQPLEEIPRYYSLSSINLSTLRRYKLSEGVRPSKVFPALASGQPLIYVGEGEGAEIVKESGGGIVLEPENPELLAKTILELLKDPGLCHELSLKGREYVIKHYSWQRIIQNWLDQLK